MIERVEERRESPDVAPAFPLRSAVALISKEHTEEEIQDKERGKVEVNIRFN